MSDNGENSKTLRGMIQALHDEMVEIERRGDVRHYENQERLTRIEGQNSHLDECLDSMKKKLFGNGQPGVLQILDSRVTGNEKMLYRILALGGAVAMIVNTILIVAQFYLRK